MPGTTPRHINETDNPYRSPASKGLDTVAASSPARWWCYVAIHFAATALDWVGSYVYIAKVNGVWRPPESAEPILNVALLCTLPLLFAAFFIDLYLLKLVAQALKGIWRIALADCVLTAAQVLALLYPAVAT